MNAVRQGQADTGYGLEHRLRLKRAAQAFELAPAAAAHQLLDRRGDRMADARQGNEPVQSLTIEDLGDVAAEATHGIGGPPVGADPKRVGILVLKQVGRRAPALGDHLIRGHGHIRLFISLVGARSLMHVKAGKPAWPYWIIIRIAPMSSTRR